MKTVVLSNGFEAFDFKPCKRGILGDKWISATLDSAATPYAIWGLDGKCAYVHNCDKLDLSGFDLPDETDIEHLVAHV